MKIAITTSSFAKFSDEPLQLLNDKGIEYVLNPHGRKLTKEEAIDLLQGCIGVAAGTEPLSADVMAALPELKVISRCGTGMDNVDIKRGRGSINMMAQDLQFVTLRDAFMTVKTLKDVDKIDLNDRVKRILKPRLAEFLEWKTRSEKRNN